MRSTRLLDPNPEIAAPVRTPMLIRTPNRSSENSSASTPVRSEESRPPVGLFSSPTAPVVTSSNGARPAPSGFFAAAPEERPAPSGFFGGSDSGGGGDVPGITRQVQTFSLGRGQKVSVKPSSQQVLAPSSIVVKPPAEQVDEDLDELYRCQEVFEGLFLKPELLNGVYMAEFNRPSRIQMETLPVMLANPPCNMIAQGQSGTGKTVAFAITILQRLDPTLRKPQAIVVEPAFELATQTATVIENLARHTYTGVSIRAAVKGERLARGEQITDQVVIGTPGKLQDWIVKNKNLCVKEIRVFVFDEADQMLAVQGHRDQSIRIYKELNLEKVQVLLFSATYDDDCREFMEAVVPEPRMEIKIRPEELTVKNIKQVYVRCPTEEEKYRAIENIYGFLSVGSCMVFCRTRRGTASLAEKLRSNYHDVAILSGEMEIDQRNEVIDRFRAGYARVLITTDVLSRGIDIKHVTLVINYDLPVDMQRKTDMETYLHRIGRTGRFGKKGVALNIVETEEDEERIKEIMEYYKCQIEFIDFDKVEDLLKISNEKTGISSQTHRHPGPSGIGRGRIPRRD